MTGTKSLMLVCLVLGAPLFLNAAEPERSSYSIERVVAHSGFDGTMCWVHARAGVIPAKSKGNDSSQPRVVMTMQKLLLTGSDVFYRLHGTESRDGGETWTKPNPYDSFARQRFDASSKPWPTGAEIAAELLQTGDETTVCDFTPGWHAASQRLLGIGHTVWYRDNRVMHVRPRGIAYAVFNPERDQWNPWKTVQLPDEPRFRCAGSGSAQRVDCLGGDVLVPFYCKEPHEKQYQTVVARCRFDGDTLHYIEHGNALTLPIKRGLYEPSLVRFAGKVFLTMRNDDRGYVSVSEDGLHYRDPIAWTFDDGGDLGNYNTQQHWVAHNDGLFLVYTRRGANNDHVFRHRAPLFIARVDPEKLCVLRETERVLVPENGARLGNFGVVDVSPNETWVTVTEWMQPQGVEAYGSDNRVHVAKLKWEQPAESSHGKSGQHDAKDGVALKTYSRPPRSLEDDLGDYRSPLIFADGRVVSKAEQWPERRREIVQRWRERLGRWPTLITEPNVEILETERREGFVQHQIRFQWVPGQVTTGYLLIPDGPGPHPAVITVYYEPETAIGEGKAERDFAIQLTRRGFVTLSLGTTEATRAKEYSIYYPTIRDAEVEPLSMLGCAAANAWYVLAGRDDVDSGRIGIVGHSFGGKWAMFASCLFDKFACAAWSDPGIVFDESRPSVNYWEPWYLGYHPKPWRQRGLITAEQPAYGAYPKLRGEGMDLQELHALMAPRPFLVSGGSEDPIERWRPLNHTRQVNRLLGADERVWMTNRPDHSPNAASNEVIYRFFETYLMPAAK